MPRFSNINHLNCCEILTVAKYLFNSQIKSLTDAEQGAKNLVVPMLSSVDLICPVAKVYLHLIRGFNNDHSCWALPFR